MIQHIFIIMPKYKLAFLLPWNSMLISFLFKISVNVLQNISFKISVSAVALNGMKVCSYAFSLLKTFTSQRIPWSTKISFSEIRSWAAKKLSRVNCIYWYKTLLQIQICPRIILYVIVKLITFRTEQVGVGSYVNIYSNLELKFDFKLFKTILYSFFMSI